MAEQAEQPVLRRKVGARRASQGLAEMTPNKAMRMALAKAGDKVLKVPVTLRDMKRATLALDDLAGSMPDPSLILQMEGVGRTVALAVLCPQVVAAAIESQTMGRVVKGEAAARKATATDATMTSAFIDFAIEGFSVLAEDCRGLPAIEGYRVTDRILDFRAAGMVLEDADHFHIAVDLDFASGAKSGTIHLVLPTRQRKPRPGAEPEDWGPALEKVVMSSPARLEGHLCRFKMPLMDATRLEPGQVVPLKNASLDSVDLIATNGRKVISARLGRSGPMRAVRLRVGDAPPRTALGQDMSGLGLASGGMAAADPAPMDLDVPMGMPDVPGAEPVADLPATLDNMDLDGMQMGAMPMDLDMDLPGL